MPLVDRIQIARDRLLSGQFANEASVSNGVVLPILDALGWDVFDPRAVAPEYSVGGRRVDFALIAGNGPAVFVEVKQPGLTVGADKQLFEYAFHVGIQMAVLTDGTTWHVYLPAMPGSYDERRAYLLNLLEREPTESAARLERYLGHSAVASGDALRNAQHDYQQAVQNRAARGAIPQAWANLIGSEDSPLVSLLAEEVVSASGAQPADADLRAFLSSLTPTGTALPPPRPEPRPRVRPAPQPAAAPNVTPTSPLDQRGFMLDGQFTPGRNGRDVMAKAFQSLMARDLSFADRFIALPKHGGKRRYLARRREDLYPGHPEILRGNVTEVAPGYYLGTHYSYTEIGRILRLAAETAGLAYGIDLVVRLDKPEAGGG